MEDRFILTYLSRGFSHHGRGGMPEQSGHFMSGKQKKEAQWSQTGVLPFLLIPSGPPTHRMGSPAAEWVFPLR